MTNPNSQPILSIVYVTGSDVIPESAELSTLTVFSDEQGNHVDEAELAPIKDAIEQACDRLDVPYRFIQIYRIERLGTKEDAYFHALRLENLPRGRKRKSGQSN